MYKKLRQICALALVAMTAASCVTQKQMTYLRDADASQTQAINANFTSQSETVLRSGDAITVFITALDQEAVTPYNLPTAVYATPGTDKVQATPTLQYYIIDANGDVTLPVMGAVHVAGLTSTAAAQAIREKLETQVVSPSVQVRLINAKVSVLGEVNRPGQIALTGERITILDALAAAGDMTVYGKRDNVLITREVNGQIELARVDVGSAELYSSPYYYLQQNDVVYVTPSTVRAGQGEINENYFKSGSFWISLASISMTTVNFIIALSNRAKSNK